MKIFLDDQMNFSGMPNRQVPEGFVGVHNFKEFKEVLDGALERGEKIEALDFDNDLGDGELQGWEIAKWLTDQHPEIFEEVKELKSHSENSGGGKERIEYYFKLGLKNYPELIEAKNKPHPWGEMEHIR